MSIALDPTVCTQVSSHYVDVEVSSELTRGMTVVDRLNVSGDERNSPVWRGTLQAQVVWTIDNKRWKQSLYAALRG
jgi:purine nucleosidase